MIITKKDEADMNFEEIQSLVDGDNDRAAASAVNAKQRRRSSHSLLKLLLFGLSAIVAIILVMKKRQSADDSTIASANKDGETGGDEPANLQQDEEQQQQYDWWALHQQLDQDASREVVELEAKLPRFLSISSNDTIWSNRELYDKLLPILRDRGLILVGDSTTRVLYGFLWCLMDGLFFEEGYDTSESVLVGKCGELQKRLKEACGGGLEDSTKEEMAYECWNKAHFQNQTEPLNLQFLNGYQLDALTNETKDGLAKDAISGRIVYLGLPCMHSLWAPGRFETVVKSNDTDWAERFNSLLDSLHQSLPSSNVTLLLGTPGSICNERLGPQTALIRAYLKGETISPETTPDLVRFYNGPKRNGQDVFLFPENYTGTGVPLRTEFRANNHSHDFALFDDTGNLKCTAVCLKSFLERQQQQQQHQWTVLDIHNATANSCEFTNDGKHYNHGKPLLQQMSLILKGIEINSQVSGS